MTTTCALLSRTFGCLALVCAILALVAVPEAGAEPPAPGVCETFCAPFLPSNPAGHAQCMNDCFMFGPIQCPTIPGPDGQPMCKVPGKPCTNKDGLPSSCTRVGSPDGNCWCP